jgi:hypothetical protein
VIDIAEAWLEGGGVEQHGRFCSDFDFKYFTKSLTIIRKIVDEAISRPDSCEDWLQNPSRVQSWRSIRSYLQPFLSFGENRPDAIQ